MPTDVIGLFQTRDDAARAAQALERAGFARANIRVASHGLDASNSTEAEPRAESGWSRILEKLHLIAPKPDVDFYSQGVRQGETLVSVAAAEGTSDSAVDILNRYGALNLDDRTAPYQAAPEEPSAPEEAAAPFPLGQNSPTDTQVMDAAAIARVVGAVSPPADVPAETVIPIVEERLTVSAQPVPRGAVRVYQHVIEQPVEQQIVLREEHVTVDRHPVDRPVTDADNAFRESVTEWRETEEKAVISKTARVVEEVVVGKTTTQHTETIRDTVRHTEIEVEEIADSA